MCQQQPQQLAEEAVEDDDEELPVEGQQMELESLADFNRDEPDIPLASPQPAMHALADEELPLEGQQTSDDDILHEEDLVMADTGVSHDADEHLPLEGEQLVSSSESDSGVPHGVLHLVAPPLTETVASDDHEQAADPGVAQNTDLVVRASPVPAAIDSQLMTPQEQVCIEPKKKRITPKFD